MEAGIAILSFAHPHAYGWAKALAGSEAARLAAVWDDDAERGGRAAKEHGADFVASLDEILARGDVNAVGICAETSRHEELTVRAAGAGKHVLCEKPMALSLDECDRMIEAVDKAGVTYMQSFPKRLDPVNMRMKELLDDGAVGKIGIVRVRHGHGFGLTGGLRNQWFVKPEFAGRGAFLDEGAHGADLLRWLLGEPAEVTARIGCLVTDLEVDDNGAAIYTFENGVIGELTSSWTWQAATNCVEIFGDGGTVIAQGTDNASKDMTDDDCLRIYRADSAERAWETVEVPCAFKSDNFQGGVMEAFVGCVVEGAAPPATAEDGREALHMILAAYQSSDRGRSVKIR